MIEQWPNVAEAIEELREAFGNAEIADLAGGCYAIEIVIENFGLIWIGDADGPLGETNKGWGASKSGMDWEHHEEIYTSEDRSIPPLVDAIRAYLRSKV